MAVKWEARFLPQQATGERKARSRTDVWKHSGGEVLFGHVLQLLCMNYTEIEVEVEICAIRRDGEQAGCGIGGGRKNIVP